MMPQPSGIPSLLQLAIGATASARQAKLDSQKPAWPINPFTPGIRSGSATDKVYFILSGNPKRWFEHCELMRMTGYSRGAISWALRYLAEHSQVRSIPSARHPNYRRYKLVAQNDEA